MPPSVSGPWEALYLWNNYFAIFPQRDIFRMITILKKSVQVYDKSR